MPSRSTTVRDERIDALRGFALFGILLVNIQSFLFGATNPIGYLTPDAGWLDRAVLFATAAFVNLKFMPLFAMLFGVGFSLLYAKLENDDTRAAQDLSAANAFSVRVRHLARSFFLLRRHYADVCRCGPGAVALRRSRRRRNRTRRAELVDRHGGHSLR